MPSYQICIHSMTRTRNLTQSVMVRCTAQTWPLAVVIIETTTLCA